MVTAVLCMIVVSHCLVQFLFYRGRVVNGWHAGDLVIFGLPALVAYVAYAIILRRLAHTRLVGSLLGALGITFLSFWAGVMLSLNTYGS